jgi:hypothetical protein
MRNKYLFLYVIVCVCVVTILLASQPALADIEGPGSGLVGWWKLDEGSGAIADDSSISGKNGILINSPTWTSGQINNALSFSGGRNWIDMGSPSSLKPSEALTISAWVKFNTSVSGRKIAGFGYTGAANIGWGYQLYDAGSNYLGFRISNSSTLTGCRTSKALAPNTWHHLIGTYNGTDTARFYIDGLLACSTTTAGFGPIYYDYYSEKFTVGADQSHASSVFDGAVDDVRVYDRVLPDADIAELYSYIGGPAPANRSPVVSAGNDQIITLPSIATLSGTATDDGLPVGSTLITTWSLSSGPGAVILSNVNALSATATFPAAGAYVLRLDASDGDLVSFSDVTVTVNPSVLDTTPPTIPTNLTANSISSSQINLAWTASTDNVAVTDYNIYSDSELLTIVTGTAYSDLYLTPDTSYAYTVSAFDAAGNTSDKTASVSSTTFTATPPDAGLVGWWKFDEGSGTIAHDSSGHGNDGIVLGTPNWTTGYIGGGLLFDGKTNLVRIPLNASLGLGTKTIAVWANLGGFLKKLGAFYGWGRRVSANSCADNYQGYIRPDGSITATYQNLAIQTIRPSYSIGGAGTGKLGEWAHYAFVYAGSGSNGTLSLYKNGVLVNAPYVVTDGISAGCAMTTIGSQEDLPNPAYVRTFDGIMDDYRIYNRALSASEVAALYNSTKVSFSDASSPSIPTGLAATAISSYQINLSWNASTDNIGVAGYVIYRGGSQIAVVRSGTTYADTAHPLPSVYNYSLSPSTAYTYTIAAFDAAGNFSARSVSAGATTPASSGASYTLTVHMTGTGLSTISSAPSGITCSRDSCSASFSAGTNVFLTPYPFIRGMYFPSIPSFGGWQGSGCGGSGECHIIMDSDKSVTAFYGVTP